jgi:protein-S-isoprenylcysteine O-methyltransferase Ste14
MKELNKKAFAGLLGLLIGMGWLLFVSARTFDYWQAWIFLAVFFAAAQAITFYLMRNDPKLLERRINAGPGAEKDKNQKIIQTLAMISFMAIFVFCGIDHRFGWSTAPAYVVATGDILVALGFLFIFFVFKENTFASGIIEVGAEQKLITTGPYAFIRHPMYTGGLVMLLGVPLALGSWWGLFMIIPITLVIVWRLLEEEKFLAKNLSGYSGYRNKVTYRLLPLIW